VTESDDRNAFQRELRLRRLAEFRRVYAANVRAQSGPLVVWGCPNDTTHSRLGLAVSRRTGGAAVRSRIKRMLRESFRLIRRELPAGYDLVISVRPHDALTLEGYQTHLLEAARRLERTWQRKRRTSETGRQDPSPAG
jgi:ribonuclease P protein component